MGDLPSWVKVGAECVCIKRDPWVVQTGFPGPLSRQPAFGERCTITFIEFYAGSVYFGLAGYSDETDGRFNIRHFRPLVDDQLERDLSIFRPLLKTERFDA